MLYFAYGSNINLDQMARRCPNASVVAPVALENYQLLFRRGGFATIEPKEGAVVQGLMWHLTPECVKSLDRYEGYPTFYDRGEVTVTVPSGETLPITTYRMTEEHIQEATLPTTTYYNGIMEGYKDNKLPTKALVDALNYCKSEVKSLGQMSLYPKKKGKPSHER